MPTNTTNNFINFIRHYKLPIILTQIKDVKIKENYRMLINSRTKKMQE